jgi:hypothetical protein
MKVAEAVITFRVSKTKAVPLSYTGAKGERKYSSYSSVTALGWVVRVTPRPRFTPGKGLQYPLARRLGSLHSEPIGKILCLWQRSNPGCPFCSQTLYWLSYPVSKLWQESHDITYVMYEFRVKHVILDIWCLKTLERFLSMWQQHLSLMYINEAWNNNLFYSQISNWNCTIIFTKQNKYVELKCVTILMFHLT